MSMLVNYKYPPRRGLRAKGSAILILSVISAGVVAFTALSLSKVNSIVFHGLNASKFAMTAQQYAEAEAAIINMANPLPSNQLVTQSDIS